uniref:Uncharacterized protein n=1 Tax=Parascaris equorum TaxID=6256 RepID=A0A914RPM6_PAREQ
MPTNYAIYSGYYKLFNVAMNDSNATLARYNTTISSLLRDPSCYIVDTDYLLERFWLLLHSIL